MTQVATPGRIVLYTLSEQDADQINRRRREESAERSQMHISQLGNQAHAGDMYPAVVVRTFGGPSVNLQVLLDGPDAHWATSRGETDSDAREPGKWFWPALA